MHLGDDSDSALAKHARVGVGTCDETDAYKEIMSAKTPGGFTNSLCRYPLPRRRSGTLYDLVIEQVRPHTGDVGVRTNPIAARSSTRKATSPQAEPWKPQRLRRSTSNSHRKSTSEWAMKGPLVEQRRVNGRYEVLAAGPRRRLASPRDAHPRQQGCNVVKLRHGMHSLRPDVVSVVDDASRLLTRHLGSLAMCS